MPVKEKIKIAIIIINYNGFKDTKDCLLSLNKLKNNNFFKVYLVDNGSSDDSLIKIHKFLKIAKLNYPLELIISKNNLGFAGGNNLGIKKALKDGFNYFLLLNNDTEVTPDFLAKLIEVSKKNPKAGIIGPKIMYYSQPNKIWFGGGKFSWFGGGKHLRFNEIEKPKNSNAQKQILNSQPLLVDWITACCMLIKREVIKKIGLLQEKYFLYYEDTDYNLRARKAGFNILYVPNSVIYHKVSSFTKTLGNPTIWYYHFRNALYLAYNNAPFFLGKIAIHFWAGYKLFKQLIKYLIPSKRESSKAIIKGIIDFYKGKMGKIN